MIMVKRIHIGLLFLIVIRLYALDSQTELRHLTTSEGLSDNTVNCIYQDRFGLMWFGTPFGLNQYDGYSFKVYHHDPSDSTSIGDDNINAIIEDTQGDLWMGTAYGGLNQFIRDKRVFVHYVHEVDDSTSLSDDFVRCLYLDSHGEMWIGTASGISVFEKDGDSFTRYLPDQYVKVIYEDSEGLLWIGTAFQGLFRRNRSGEFIQYVHDPEDPFSISTNLIESIVEDTLHNLWIGTLDGGLNRFDRESGRFFHYRNIPKEPKSKANNTVFSLLRDRTGALWAGTENGGLNRITIRQDRQATGPSVSFDVRVHDKNDPGSLSNNTVLSLFEDRTGNLWIGTFSGGIDLYPRHKKPFKNYRVEPYHETGLNHNIVRCFLEDKRGNLWIGTDGGGLNYFDRSRDVFTHFTYDPEDPTGIGNNHVLDICEDHAGNLWIATWDGLNCLDPSRRRFIRYRHDEQNPNSLTSSKVTCVIEDAARNLWVGTLFGLNVFDPVRNTFFHAFEGASSGLSNACIQSLYIDGAGNMWVGSVLGLHLLTRNNLARQRFEFTQFVNQKGDTSSLSDDHALSILEDSRGRLWVATLNGLNCFFTEKQKFVAFTEKEGLASNRIASVLEDNEGFIWAGTQKGISRLDPSTGRAISFDARDGLVGDDFTQGAVKTREGELVFGGKSGFTLFIPDSITTCSYIPPIVLTDFQVFNRSIPFFTVQKKQVQPDSLAIELSHDQDVFSFEFAALDYTAPEKNQYRYKLDGFDHEWRMTDAKRRFATYTNLPPGGYVFRVKGSNSDGLWNEKGLSIGLRIHPPFWRTRWALFLYAGVIIGAMFLLRQLILYREKIKNEIKLERREAERIHELDAMKLSFFTNVSHEFRTPVTLIIGLLERLMRSKGPFLRKELLNNYQIMLRNARRLLRLINQIMDIRKLDAGVMKLALKKRDIIHFIKAIFSSFAFQAEQRNIRYQFTSDTEHLSIWFDADKVEKIIYNVLSNAFKFTKDGGAILVDIVVASADIATRNQKMDEDEERKYLEIRIEDDGIGIPDEYLEKIFDPFVQVENEEIGSSIGTGVGLTLTRELIALHQGTIGVTSRLDSGSCFTVRLPLFLVPEHADSITVEDPQDDDILELSLAHPEDVASHSFLTHDSNKAAPLILFADDEIDFLNYLREELSPDYRVIVASNGETAYKLAIENNPDLVVSDVRMPKMDGFTLCSALKQNKKTSYIPFILLTSQTNEKSHIDGFDLGADDYIDKPFDIQLLRKRITNLLTSRRELRERFSHEIYLQPRNIVITPADERFLRHVIESIDEHIEDSTFSVSRLGSEIGLSRVQLYRKIKTLTKMTPNDLIKMLRLKRSAQLLEKSHLTTSEIAYRVGFKDPSYFCKCFRNEYGVSPMEYTRHTENKQNQKVISDSRPSKG